MSAAGSGPGDAQVHVYLAEDTATDGGPRWEQSDLGLRLVDLQRRAAQLTAEWAALTDHKQRLDQELAAAQPQRPESDALGWNLQFIPGFDDGPPPAIADAALAQRFAVVTEWGARLRSEESRLSQERAELQTRVAPLALRPLALRQLIARAREAHLQAQPPRLLTVNGPVVFRYPFRRRAARLDAAMGRLVVVRETVARWLVHDGPEGHILVRQRRRALSETALRHQRAEDEQLREDLGRLRQRLDLPEAPLPPVAPDEHARCPDPAGRWLARVEGPFDEAALLRRFDECCADDEGPATPADAQVLPLLLRRALLLHRSRSAG